jgi:WD40 repeat protein/serine/threonine protein kinase
MSACPSCQHELDEASRTAGRCPSCGAVWRQLPQRTIADVRFPAANTIEEYPPNEVTIELPAGDTAGQSVDQETLASLELSQSRSSFDGPSIQPLTVDFSAEQTIEFLGGSKEIDESMLTSHWEGSLGASAPTDSRATIKQKETIRGSFMTSSSLVVKSRQVLPTGAVTTPITSAAEAPDYELLNIIGEGGMGVVYAARQSSIARTVALKMLKDGDHKNVAQRDKFISEAVVTGELDHPNIVPIYDLGADNQGALFYSMKRVKGTPWNKVLKQKSLDDNLTILLRVADAVAFAHVNGVIHRDLKPENVMLGDFGEVLVMDWGLARVSPEFPNAASVSQSDAMGGTPAYMAPEMATGPLEKITKASDVYLLGAILYEILAGRPPHSGKTVMACLFAAAKNQIQPAEGVSGELFEIAKKAMATEPEDRHENVPAFQRAVREYQSHSQSIQLVEHAQRNMLLAKERQDYELYARVMYGLEESLALWPENPRASALLSTARIEYAKLALDKGDFDLGASLLDSSVEEHRELLARLEAGRRERESRKRRIRVLKGAVAALVASVIVVVSVAFAAVRKERNEAVVQRDRAVVAEGEANKNFKEAETARQEALAQKNTAEQQRDRATKAEGEAKVNLVEAVKQKNIADAQTVEATKQRDLANESKKAEEYSAYIARIGLTKTKIDENAFDRATELLAECPPNLRNWEWGRLNYLCNLADKSWKNAAPVEAIAFSPDGVHFAIGDRADKASIWNLQTGKPERELSQAQYVYSVAYDPRGERLAAGGSDGSVHIYRTADGELIAPLDGHTDGVLSVRFSPDGQWLVTCGYDQTARLWNLATRQTTQILRGHSWWVWSAEFSPDGNRIVTAGQDGKAIIWLRASIAKKSRRTALREAAKNLSPDEFINETEFTQHHGPVYAAKFAPDGLHIASAGYDGRVLVWNLEETRPVDIERRLDREPEAPVPFTTLAGHRGPVRTIAFSPDGKSVASGGQDNMIVLSDVASGKELRQLRGHASHVNSVAYSPDGAWVLSGGRDAQIKLWNPAGHSETLALAADHNEIPDSVLSARFSRDGKEIVTASHDRTASLWDATTLVRRQWFHEGHDFLASSAVFFADGTRLATGAGDGTVRMWDVAAGTELSHLENTGRTAALDVSDDGKLIATGGGGNEVQIWDAANGQKLATLTGHEAEVTSLRFAPGGTLLASGGDRGLVRLWRRDAATNKWTAGPVLRGHSRTITAMHFIDRGARLVTASGDNTCGQWGVATGQEIPAGLLRHPDYVADLAVSADGRLGLTCCDDGKLRLWSLADARLLRTLEPRKKDLAFTSIDLSADGRLATAACAADGTVQLWNLDAGQEITIANDKGQPQSWLDMGGRGGIVWAARFAPIGERLLVIGGNDARLYDIVTRKLAVRFSPHGVVASADISPDEKRIVTGSWDRSAKIWDAARGKVLVKLDNIHAGYINSVCYSPDGSRILTASDDGTARLFNAADGAPLEPVLKHHTGRVLQACFSPDGSRILTVSSDKTAKIVDAKTGNVMLTLTGHEWAVRSGAFSRDGSRIITGSDDNTAIVWDAATGKTLQTLKGHTAAVTSVALSADNVRAITGSEDNSAKLWDAATGKEIITLAGHAEEVTSVSFSPEGRTALTSGRDGRTLLWPALEWKEPATLSQQ